MVDNEEVRNDFVHLGLRPFSWPLKFGDKMSPSFLYRA